MHRHDASCYVHTFPLFAPYDDMLTMLVCATCWLYMHLYMPAYMSMHESCLLVCHPCFNTMKLWTFDPSFCSSWTPPFVCFLECLPFHLFARILVSMFAISIMFICFMPLSCALCIFSFHCLHAGFLSLPLHVHTRSEDVCS